MKSMSKATNSGVDMAVDVTGFARSSDIRLGATKEDPDETEYSSSFADTNDNASAPSDTEVDSQFSPLASSFDEFSGLFPIRKKKLTAHWREFVRPIMWRCKWAELKMKELQLRAAKYKREISALDRIKHRAVDEESGSKSLPFTIHPRHRKKAMKRRKRKRVEDATDVMSTHYLFSYFENKKLDLDAVSAGDDAEENTNGDDEFGIHDDSTILESNNGFQEQILRKIELVHSRVHKLKEQLDTVMTKNAIKFSSSENLMSFDGQAGSSIRSPTFSADAGMVDYDLGEFIMPPDITVSSYGEAIPIPDIIESTVGLLSSVDVTQHQPQVGDSSERIVDNILIHNEVEGQILTVNCDKSLEKHQEVVGNNVEEESSNPPPTASEPNAQEQSTLKSCLASEFLLPKNKRKRGERKAGSGGWNRKMPGEPDSQ